MKTILAALVFAVMAVPAMAGTTCIDLGGGMVSCSSSDGSHVTGTDLGGGMRTYNGNIGGQPFNGTDTNLGGGMRTFNGNIGGSPFNRTCTTFGGITTCN